VPFAVQIPFADIAGIELVGARLTRYNGRQAVLFNLEAGGERVSVLQVAADPSEDSVSEPQTEAHQGYRVVTFRHKGLTNSVVGNVGQAALDQFRRNIVLKPASFRR
jgi:anti-sigma factor RsiW